jgi:hypothetical protein
MIAAPQMFEVGAVVLGYVGNVASWRRLSAAVPDNGRYPPLLTIHTCSSTVDEGGYTPAASVTLSGRESLLALRAAIDAALNEGASAQATGAAS